MSNLEHVKPFRVRPGTEGPHLKNLRQDKSPTLSQAPAALSARNLRKSYHKNRLEIPVLQSVNLTVRQGEFLSIVGQSGSGKSTLLHVLGTLDEPDAGELYFGERRVDNLAPRERDQVRNRQIGMIFQFYHLLPELTALENVLSPLMIRMSAWSYWRNRRQYQQQAQDLLELVGLGHRIKHKPREMSGGEMQRTAIARALIGGPQLLLADEPTGNLDRSTGEEIMATLRALNEEQQLTIVMVTHDLAIADRADRSTRLVEGRLEAA